IHPARESASRDHAPISNGGASIRQCMASDHIDDARPTLLEQGFPRAGELRTIKNLGRTQLLEKFRFGRPPRHGGDAIPELRQDRDRYTPHATGRAGYEDLA